MVQSHRYNVDLIDTGSVLELSTLPCQISCNTYDKHDFVFNFTFSSVFRIVGPSLCTLIASTYRCAYLDDFLRLISTRKRRSNTQNTICYCRFLFAVGALIQLKFVITYCITRLCDVITPSKIRLVVYNHAKKNPRRIKFTQSRISQPQNPVAPKSRKAQIH